jgi:hypothetical protein
MTGSADDARSSRGRYRSYGGCRLATSRGEGLHIVNQRPTVARGKCGPGRHCGPLDSQAEGAVETDVDRLDVARIDVSPECLAGEVPGLWIQERSEGTIPVPVLPVAARAEALKQFLPVLRYLSPPPIFSGVRGCRDSANSPSRRQRPYCRDSCRTTPLQRSRASPPAAKKHLDGNPSNRSNACARCERTGL